MFTQKTLCIEQNIQYTISVLFMCVLLGGGEKKERWEEDLGEDTPSSGQQYGRLELVSHLYPQ